MRKAAEQEGNCILGVALARAVAAKPLSGVLKSRDV